MSLGRAAALILCVILIPACNYKIDIKDREAFVEIAKKVDGSKFTPAVTGVYQYLNAAILPNKAEPQAVGDTKKQDIDPVLARLDGKIVAEPPPPKEYNDEDLRKVMGEIELLNNNVSKLVVMSIDSGIYNFDRATRIRINEVVLYTIGMQAKEMTGRMDRHILENDYWKKFGKFLLESAIRIAVALAGAKSTEFPVQLSAVPNMPPTFDGMLEFLAMPSSAVVSTMPAEALRARSFETFEAITAWLNFLSFTLRRLAGASEASINASAEAKERLKSELLKDPSEKQKYGLVVDVAVEAIFLLLARVRLSPTLKATLLEIAEFVDGLDIKTKSMRARMR